MHQPWPHNETKAVVTYVLSFLMLYWFVLLTVKWWRHDPLVSSLNWLSPTIALTVVALEQEIMLLGLVMFIFYKLLLPSRHFFAHIKKYIHDRCQWKWRSYFWNYVTWSFLLYYIINIIIFFILRYFNRELPWLYGEQTTIVLLQTLALKHTWEYIVLWSIVLIFGPIVEEIIYRWFITANLFI